MLNYIDAISMQLANIFNNAQTTNSILLKNKLKIPVSGILTVRIKSLETNKLISETNKPVTIPPKSDKLVSDAVPAKEDLYYECVFTEKLSGETIFETGRLPYILTPKPGAAPRINGAAVVGVRPNSPFLYKIAASGQKPMHYTVKGLPAGLNVDPNTGIITGTLTNRGTYKMILTAGNATG
ncbi:MAG: hypothetical protein EOP47_27505, partial [Sphingobacteriaceae bacterium]